MFKQHKLVSFATTLFLAIAATFQINASKPGAPGNSSSSRQVPTSYVLLADGFDESEALVPVDVLRRADMNVKTVSVSADSNVKSSGGHVVTADMTIDKLTPGDADWLIVSDGISGSENLSSGTTLGDLIADYYRSGGKVAAIGASPALVLYPLGILDGQDATCDSCYAEQCPKAHMTCRQVVSHPRLITASGDGAAYPFAFAIVAATRGIEYANGLAASMAQK